jgi:hypothetical protein
MSADPVDVLLDAVPRLGWDDSVIRGALCQLHRVGLITLYEIEGHPYMEMARFEDFQVGMRKEREAPSTIPPPTGRPPHWPEFKHVRPTMSKPPAKPEPIYFDMTKREWVNISDGMVKEWSEAYPACDVRLCLRQMRAWIVENPKKIKSKWGRFVISWLAREQQRGGMSLYGREPGRRPNPGKTVGAHPPPTPEQKAEQRARDEAANRENERLRRLYEPAIEKIRTAKPQGWEAAARALADRWARKIERFSSFHPKRPPQDPDCRQGSGAACLSHGDCDGCPWAKKEKKDT